MLRAKMSWGGIMPATDQHKTQQGYSFKSRSSMKLFFKRASSKMNGAGSVPGIAEGQKRDA
jgi:hypothetical protein